MPEDVRLLGQRQGLFTTQSNSSIHGIAFALVP